VENIPQQPVPRYEAYELGSWRFSAASGCISGREQLENIQKRLPEARTLPEMLFGSNYLSVKHMESGLEVFIPVSLQCSVHIALCVTTMWAHASVDMPADSV
jgi:hypothetical protein